MRAQRVSMVLALWLLISYTAGLVTAQGEKALRREPSAQEIRAYKELYTASVIRNLRYADAPDPEEAIREDIVLEAELAHRARAAGVATDPLLQADVRHYQAREILDEVLRRRVPEDAVTSADIEHFYQTHQEEFRTSDMVRFRHIFFFVPRGDVRAERDKLATAQKLRERIRQGMDFSALAREYSELASAKRTGGAVGPELLFKLNPAVRDALLALAPGEVSEPVRTPYGWELLQLVEKIPSRVRPLAEVAPQIRLQLLKTKAAELQNTLVRDLPRRFPARLNKELLESSAPLVRSEWVFEIAGTTFPVERVLADIKATWSYEHIQDDREKIRAALPRLVLTQQVLLVARQEGLLDDARLRTKLALIENRLVGERYWRNLVPTAQPTEAQLRSLYERDKEVFRTPPRAKGVLFRWTYAKLAETTASPTHPFVRRMLEEKVAAYRRGAVEGRLALADLRKVADETVELDWFREGPNGYHFDRAFFSTKPGSFTEPFPTKDGVAFGWVEAREDPQPLPFEECRDLVERRWRNLQADELRQKAVEEILANYARHRR